MFGNSDKIEKLEREIRDLKTSSRLLESDIEHLRTYRLESDIEHLRTYTHEMHEIKNIKECIVSLQKDMGWLQLFIAGKISMPFKEIKNGK